MADDNELEFPDDPAGDGGSELPPEPPKSKSVLMDILERAKQDTENETAKLRSSLREREQEEKQRKLEEEQIRAKESRQRVEEERKKREAALQEYENRKAREAEDERMRIAMEDEAARPQQPEKSRTPQFVALAAVLVAAVGVGAWFLFPKGEPEFFRLDQPAAKAKPGLFERQAVPFGPATLVASSGVIPPNKLVMVMKPRKYEAAAPKPKRVRKSVKSSNKTSTPRIRIQTGILGGKKVIR